jgi:hypothetical protein
LARLQEDRKMIAVTLTAEDVAHAEHVGMMRLRASGNSGRNPARSQDRPITERIFHERLGCMGEIAVARHLGITWEGTVNTFHTRPDVGPFDVRTTNRRNGCLIIRDNDDPDVPVVLVYGSGTNDDPVMWLVGWMYGRDARRPEWLRDPHGKRPSWFVPAAKLRPIPDTVRSAR